ncbi:hypothetical protein GCM10009745_50090 [Kribbella yunnanensis]|uniref:Uncharacterized protein n=1 Tax=Kribbella yunnanensis TaxID=190194 RepID=A0ABP4U5K3_9ACTN
MVEVVGLVRVLGYAVAAAGAAGEALVDEHVALGGVVLEHDGTHERAARVGAIAWCDVNVQ